MTLSVNPCAQKRTSQSALRRDPACSYSAGPGGPAAGAAKRYFMTVSDGCGGDAH